MSNYAGSYTFHQDNMRSGQNVSETVLTLSDVNQAQFGKLLTYALDGLSYGSPLYVANVNIPGQGFHNADKDHIHHRLLRLGHGHRRTVVILWLWTALLSGMILFPLYEPGVNVFIPVGVAAMAVGLYTWFHPGLKRNATDEPLPAPVPVASSGGFPTEMQ